ncbi:hypothetical protein F5148DRAFT_982563 [Russula earlei]|uniref:Uncharacterized protein n=1 Tax=Russula earlei TaxID=71964 RepID=A0ACC0U502_9AGAM|nr:hypothetical protein F5148DRAFT_982563 [Russula earlei]
MIVVALAILASTRASPLGKTSPPLVSLDQLHVRAPSCDNPHGCRSLWNIIWSCAVTILLCTWVSVHPNVPGPEETWPRVVVRRMGLMLAAIFAPEIMIIWALRQRLTAAELAERYKGEGWTITHGFFAVMGGFMEYEGNRPIRVLLPGQLDSYSLTGNGDFPRIAKAEIEDRSKADAISKSIVVLQTGWFIAQCMARGVQGLPVTELELVTVAFATLNFVMYLLWWNKPLNVQCGVRVYKKRQTGKGGEDVDGKVGNPVGFWVALRDALGKLPAAIVRGPSIPGATDQGDPWFFRVITWPILKPAWVLSGDDEYDGLMRVGTFYAGKRVTGKELLTALMVTAVALAFGSIHCIGWSFAFPATAERTLWRVASASMTIIPVPLLISIFIIAFQKVHDTLGFFTICTLMALYMLARLVLVVLPLLSLRSLPPAAYHVVHWTSLIPHV